MSLVILGQKNHISENDNLETDTYDINTSSLRFSLLFVTF